MNNEMLVAGVEGISLSNTSKLGRHLEAQMAILLKNPTKLPKKLKSLEKVLKQDTNLTASIGTIGGEGAWVVRPGIDRNSVFNINVPTNYSSFLGTQRKRLAKPGELVKGSVNLKEVLVTGVFEKLSFRIVLGEELFSGKYTAAEVTSVLLHEIGHVFVYLEMLYRSTTSNYVMEELSRGLASTNDKEVKLAMIREVRKKDYVIPKDEELMGDESTTRLLILKEQMEHAKSELGYNIYDIRGFEALADQFATRLGYGKPLASALKKVGVGSLTNMGSISLSVLAISIIALGLSPITVPGGAAGAVVSNYLFGYTGALLLFSAILGEDTTYDRSRIRFDAIRQQLSSSLKSTSMPKDEVRKILADIDDIEKVMKSSTDIPFIGFALWRISPWGRGKAKAIKIQQLLERLGNNRFGEAAANISVS